MNALRKLFIVLGLTCSGSWLLKMVAIAAYGGFAAEGRLAVEVLWSLGMGSFLLASATGVALLLPGRSPVWARVVVGVVAAPVSFVLLDGVDALVKEAYRSDGWFRDELGLVIAALAMAALALRLARRPRRDQASSPGRAASRAAPTR